MVEHALTADGLTRQKYRGLVYGVGGLAILGLLAGFVLDQHFAGTIIYLLGAWTAGGIAVLAPVWSKATLQDERDWELHNRASGILVGITMVIGLSMFPALYVLDAGSYIEITGPVSGIVVTLSALFLLYGVCLGIAKRRI
ncbi:hypothetical protein A6E15_18120 [Natrinema saccharevitans]|uniref:DUF2178 domain-containing protein n=1 Tax=Natrinema saccharevitans TaxID=301967 RepID=A0A1S8AR79_9EURY|nr:DUF2178 domain-containing protein [Natrinema saccharevitans]OLZ39313.1 hypothetical protein A6E15_18120 [Natrinema saccharevitans]